MKLTKEIINEKVEQLRKELIDMVEPKFEVGWYWSDEKAKLNKTFLSYYEKERNNNAYGFSWLKEWSNNLCCSFSEDRIKATQSEVQAALEAEAVKRGFKEGVKINSVFFKDTEVTIGSNNFSYRTEEHHNYDTLYMDGAQIYSQGKWATIIPREKTSEEWVTEYYNSDYGLSTFLDKNNLKITKK